jgi:hypothetical protein
MSIWQFQLILVRRLLQWSMVSTALGALMLVGHPFWRGVGSQFIGWAGVDAAIAYVGARLAHQRLAAPESAGNENQRTKEAHNLRALLLLNAALDLLYVRGGLWLALRGQSRLFTRGMGIGIVIQGAFLFLFDLAHALLVPGDDEGSVQPR